ncbi:hypothetical protein QBC47DRAFT_151899 [Echria macrotheca]|uniref:Uncharacterized protein n=1 Tax=Echria macrotheca TaxID=438768 RepID=A0AAJ0B1D4_9PEZI|nr:hypothetical protein QBC47DRAFT_151899 [Echria macrotheca]
MTMTTTAISRLLLLAGLARLVESAASCYRVDGKIQDSKYAWVPCNPSAAISPCCSRGDFCLDNGYCLDAGSVNNAISVQGCTDPSWGGPCRMTCPGSIDNLGYIGIYICDGANTACCGGNSSCCSGSNTFHLPVFTSLAHPLPESTATTSSSTGSAPTSPSQTNPPSSGTSDSSSSSSSTAAVATNSSDQALKVGLGVGLSLGLVLIAVVAYFIWELRKRAKEAAEARAKAEQAVLAQREMDEAAKAKSGQYTTTMQYYPSELPSREVFQLPTEMSREELDDSPTR